MKKFGEIIRDARKAKGLSLSATAGQCNTFKGYICGIEKGHVAPPSPKLTRRICKVLSLDYERLVAIGWLEKRPEGVSLYRALEVIKEAI